jgi:hypothetical protein
LFFKEMPLVSPGILSAQVSDYETAAKAKNDRGNDPLLLQSKTPQETALRLLFRTAPVYCNPLE